MRRVPTQQKMLTHLLTKVENNKQERIKELDKRVKGFVFPEVNFGQLVRETEGFTRKPVIKVSHPDGDLIDPTTILRAIEGSQK